MKYVHVIVGAVCLVAGAVGGYYYAKRKTEKLCDAEVESVKEIYQKKVDDAKKEGRLEAIKQFETGPDGEKQNLSPNGDIDDEYVVVVTEKEALEHTMEDVVYFAKDNVWYNQDEELTYNKRNVFDHPKDLFSYFGADKEDLIYLHNTKEDTWFSIRFNPGSYVENVLGYDSDDSSSDD